MENSELIKRAEDLSARCRRSGRLTQTNFLTPAERYQLESWAKRGGCEVIISGGQEGCERTAAFFLPEWMDPESFDVSEYIRAIRVTAYFGTPGHRDYMGAVLGMGVGREWIGDIRVDGDEAYIFCLPGVERHLVTIDKVGRCGVKAVAVELSEVPEPVRQVKNVSFSVMSMRLDAVVGGMFDLSRTEAAKQIAYGNVSVNYSVSEKPDLAVKPGDVVSLRGAGKGTVTGTGGTSRKGRLFVYAEIYK